MSFRVVGSSLLLLLVMAFSFPTSAPSQQSKNPAPGIRWEYRVLSLNALACSRDGSVQADLNSLGEQGWELVSYARAEPAFPTDAEGRLTISPAATGPSRDINPPTADSFQGTISMKMEPPIPGVCQMVLKRPWQPPAQQ